MAVFWIWNELEIEPTNDRRDIKRAYAKRSRRSSGGFTRRTGWRWGWRSGRRDGSGRPEEDARKGRDGRPEKSGKPEERALSARRERLRKSWGNAPERPRPSISPRQTTNSWTN